MTREKVWRYRCNYCDHANCSASAVSRHERACTLNPNRVCGMCKVAGFVQKPIAELLAAMVGSARLDRWEPLREATNNCPACMLAGIRQSPLGELYIFDFDYRAERKRFWEAQEAAKAKRRVLEPSRVQEAIRQITDFYGVGSEQE
jgi:hypothetical protein